MRPCLSARSDHGVSPDLFAVRRQGDSGYVVDPRHPTPGQGYAYLREQENLQPAVDWWSEQVKRWLGAGVRGFRLIAPAMTPPRLREALIETAAHQGSNHATFIADTTAQPRDRVAELSGFDFCLSSLPWWDGRASWLVEEYDALSRVAPVIAQVELPDKLAPVSSWQRCGRLALAAVTGSGVMLPLDYADPAAAGEEFVDLRHAIRAANDFIAHEASPMMNGQLVIFTGPGAPQTILLRANAPDARIAKQALVAIVNPDPTAAFEPKTELLGSLGSFGNSTPVGDFCRSDPTFRPVKSGCSAPNAKHRLRAVAISPRWT